MQCFAVEADFKRAAGTRYKSHFAQFRIEGHEQFLSHPSGPQDEPALGAVFDFQTRLSHKIAIFCVGG